MGNSKRKPIPLIIDTDFGGDPDDILAIWYGLTSPEIEIKAIVTADEYQTKHRAVVLKRWLATINKEIPVFYGKDLGNRELFFLNEYYNSSIQVSSLKDKIKKFWSILKKVIDNNGYYLSIGGLTNLSYLSSLDNNPLKKSKDCYYGRCN